MGGSCTLDNLLLWLALNSKTVIVADKELLFKFTPYQRQRHHLSVLLSLLSVLLQVFHFSICLMLSAHAGTKAIAICLIAGLEMTSFCLISVINKVAHAAFQLH